jgi:riboflavin biosynthesis pyrimidine reductase
MRTFREFVEQKTRDAERAAIRPLVTIEHGSQRHPIRGIGNDWTRRFYDGDFELLSAPSALPAISLVFVQSRDGNTGADNPEDLGGGATDKHLLYEGLTRVAADAVLAGAATAVGESVFFSIWHPEIVALRSELGLPRHPAQIVMSNDGHVDLMHTLLFNVPEAQVFVLAGEMCRDRCAEGFAERPWITVVPIENDLRAALARLRSEHGIQRMSVVGGRSTASSLVDAGVVQDLCLTTSARSGGAPHTPWYVGNATPSREIITRKREADSSNPILFEHFAFV